MPRKYKQEQFSGRTVLLVDDDPDYLEATRMLLEREGHRVLTAASGPEALALLKENSVDLLLLDYFMPEMNGEQVVGRLREFDSYVQVILQTGYASEQPPRELLQRLDIQGYYDKSEGPDRLLLWTEVGLKAAAALESRDESRRGLSYVLAHTPELHQIQPLNDLLQKILCQASGLHDALSRALPASRDGSSPRSSSATDCDGFLAIREDSELAVRASAGRSAGLEGAESSLPPEQLRRLRESMRNGEIEVAEEGTIVPLRVGDLTIGVIYLGRAAEREGERELLNVFANQAAVAIRNTQLYEMAMLDPLTGVYTRRFLEQWLLRSLRAAFRTQQSLELMMLDLDGMKRINDIAGHLVGDQVLATLGKVLREATRSNDMVGRYGGDEFVIILPQTPGNGAERVGERILQLASERPVAALDGPISLQVSIGMAVLSPQHFEPASVRRPIPVVYFESMAQALMQQADTALYQAKRGGGRRICQAAAIEWRPIDA